VLSSSSSAHRAGRATPRTSTTGGAIDVGKPFPDTAQARNGELTVGGVPTPALAAEFGTPLVVYCEQTVRARARAYRRTVPDALVVYGAKAFPNVALMGVLAEEGLGADVSTLGELAFARRAGLRGERLLFHGNNKSDEELRAAAEAGALVVLDALEEVERARDAGVCRVLVRLKPAVEAATHPAIRTAHPESKFGLASGEALDAVRAALEAGLDVAGLHVHVGSQLTRLEESSLAVDRLGDLCRACRAELGWTPEIVDLGGGLGIAHIQDERVPEPAEFARSLVDRFRAAWPEPARIVLEPGRSLVGQAGVTLYRVGVVKPQGAFLDVAVDGGMSDNPRPQLYAARYTALLANRTTEPADTECRIVGKHCESGDVLIERVRLPRPRRGDVVAVPATGAYTLAMGSNYNGVPRPAAVLLAGGEWRVIRERETVEDLLRPERAWRA
jgi:diaminopimelate decarboxylase